jgi:hypothetical protein
MAGSYWALIELPFSGVRLWYDRWVGIGAANLACGRFLPILPPWIIPPFIERASKTRRENEERLAQEVRLSEFLNLSAPRRALSLVKLIVRTS